MTMKKRMIIATIIMFVVLVFAIQFFVNHVYPKLKAEVKDIIHNPK